MTSSGVLLPPLPPESLERPDAGLLAEHPMLARTTVALDAVLNGSVPGVLTSACRVSGAVPDGLVMRALGVGDRREVLLHAPGPLGRLPGGTAVLSLDGRTTALLRAHHPTLRALGPGDLPPAAPDDGGAPSPLPEIRPLWPDPGIESSGELLEPESWLPAPGRGVAVLVCGSQAASHFDEASVDPGADAILRAERAVGDAFPFAVPLVRAQLFGDWLSVHAIVLATEGDRVVRARVRGDRGDPVGVAHRLVEVLMDRGAALLGPRNRSEGRPAPGPSR